MKWGDREGYIGDWGEVLLIVFEVSWKEEELIETSELKISYCVEWWRN